MRVLSRADVERLLSPPRMLDVLDAGFRAQSSGETSMPPRTAARTPHGLLGAMPGWVATHGLGIKAVTVFPGMTPSHQGTITLFDEHTGAPLCVMDAEHITALRTAGGSAVSVRLLSRLDSAVLTIVGAGVQGRAHLSVVSLIRRFGSIRIVSRSREHARRLAALDSRCIVVDDIEHAVSGADVVCCCTDAREPVLRAAWLASGAHVTSVGGTFGPELPPDLISANRVFVEWRGAAEHAPPAGAHELQGVDPAAVTELGEVLNGTRAGRERDDEITLYKSTGVAFEDVAVARLVYDEALAANAGVEVAM